MAKLPLMMAYSVSPSERGSCAASSGMNLSLRGFSAMLDDVRTSVARIDAAASRAREIARGSAGQLTVGLVSSALFGTLPRALRALRQQAPGVRVILREMRNAEQAEALQTGAKIGRASCRERV